MAAFMLAQAEPSLAAGSSWWLPETAPTIISTVISTLIASLVAWLVASYSNRSEERRDLHDQVDKLIELTMAYPFVDDPDVYDNWPSTPLNQHDTIRYGSYCCFVFNLLSKAWTFCNNDRASMKSFIHAEELIRQHQKWWSGDAENKKGYPADFRSFVDATIKQQHRETQP